MKQLLITIAFVVLVGCGERLATESELTEAAEMLYAEKPIADRKLIAAIRSGKTQDVKQAISNGANLKTRDVNGWTPLDWTTDSSQSEIVDIAEIIIDAGANVNTVDYEGMTPLHWSAMYGKKELSILFIKKGANVSVKNEEGMSPLYGAAANGHKEVVELLISKGADVNAKNHDDETPLDWSIKLKRPEIADLLRKHGAKTGEELKAERK